MKICLQTKENSGTSPESWSCYWRSKADGSQWSLHYGKAEIIIEPIMGGSLLRSRVFDRFAALRRPWPCSIRVFRWVSYTRILNPLWLYARRLGVRSLQSYSKQNAPPCGGAFCLELMGGVEQISNSETVEISRKERRPSHGVSKSVSKSCYKELFFWLFCDDHGNHNINNGISPNHRHISSYNKRLF